MNTRINAFTVSSALVQGSSREQLRTPELERPFHGVRVLRGSLREHPDRCVAYAVRMAKDHAFSGVSAAHLWRLPLPAALRDPPEVVVSAPLPRRAPRGRGVHGRSHDPSRVVIETIEGLRVLSPADTWCSLAPLLDVPDLVAVGDAIVTPPFGSDRALGSLADLGEAIDRRPGARGLEPMKRAFPLIRVGPLSRPESLIRVSAVAVGLPEPVPNLEVWIGGGRFMLDEAWPDYRVGLDYHGDYHRDPEQFRKDLSRAAAIREEWAYLEAGANDLFVEPGPLLARVERMLRTAGWRPENPIDLSRIPDFRR